MKTTTTTTRNTNESHNLAGLLDGLRRSALLGATVAALGSLIACGGNYGDDPVPVVEKSLGLVEGSVSFNGRTPDRSDALGQLADVERANPGTPAIDKREPRRVGNTSQTAKLGTVADRHPQQRFERRYPKMGLANVPAGPVTDATSLAPKKTVGQPIVADDATWTLAKNAECPKWASCRLCAVATGRCACIQCDKDDPMAPATQRLVPAIDSELDSNTPSTTDPVPHPGGGLIDPPLN